MSDKEKTYIALGILDRLRECIVTGDQTLVQVKIERPHEPEHDAAGEVTGWVAADCVVYTFVVKAG